jgi:ribosomal protein L17
MKLKTTLDQIRRQVYNGQMTKSNGRSYSEASKDHYNKIIKIILPLVEDFDIEEVDVYRNTETKSRIYVRKRMGEWIMSLRNKIRNNGNTAGTENVYVSVIKWYFSKIEQEYAIKIDTSDPRWNPIDVPTKMIVPDTDRMVELIKNQPSFTTENQKKAYRYIVASMITTARYKDLSTWTEANLVRDSDETYLVYSPSKTPNKVIQMKVIPRLMQVFSTKGNLLPKIPYTTLRRSIKEVMMLAGFTEEVRKDIYVGEKLYTKRAEAWELYGCHRFRAGAITGMLSQGLTESEVKSFSGHSGNSKSFERYVEFSRKQKDNAIDKFSTLFE